ncbi:MAG: alpha/beta hydrolase [Nocardioidaceae bacterium]
MSRPRTLELDRSVRRTELSTERGTFATWVCEPHDTSMPRGNVLLIPGFTGSKEDFAPLLPLLAAAGWRTATYDQRGQFETPGSLGDDFSLEGFAADAASVAGQLFGLTGPAHLVGHSFGGLVAGAAAIGHPERWASLSLMCSGPGALPGERGRAALRGAELLEREGLEAARLAKEHDNQQRGIEPSPPEVEAFLDRRFMANAPASLAAMARHIGRAPDRTDELADLALPVAVLRGEHDDAFPHAAQDALASALGTSVVVIPDAAHSPAVEQPERTRDALVRIWLG